MAILEPSSVGENVRSSRVPFRKQFTEAGFSAVLARLGGAMILPSPILFNKELSPAQLREGDIFI
jgi:hypothetical protein